MTEIITTPAEVIPVLSYLDHPCAVRIGVAPLPWEGDALEACVALGGVPGNEPSEDAWRRAMQTAINDLVRYDLSDVSSITFDRVRDPMSDPNYPHWLVVKMTKRSKESPK